MGSGMGCLLIDGLASCRADYTEDCVSWSGALSKRVKSRGCGVSIL